MVGGGLTPYQQLGIFIDAGTGGVVRNNWVTDHLFSGTGDFSVGILIGNPFATVLVMPPVLCEKNTLLNDQVGIAALLNRGSVLSSNQITGGPLCFAGIGISGDAVVALENSITCAGAQFGVVLLGQEFVIYGTASNTSLISNTISGATALSVWEQTGVTGTFKLENEILP